MWDELRKKLNLSKISSEEIDKKIRPVLRKMEKAGIKVDVDFLNNLAKKTELELDGIEKEIHLFAGEDFNINSPIQLSEVLFQKLKLPTKDLKRHKSGVISTAAGELKKIVKEHKIIALILKYRELAKLLSTYLKPLPLLIDKNSRLHTTYGQDTNTGRLTSSEPNLQNIPIKGDLGSEIRKAFIAEEGKELISADYSQIELRIVSKMANDTAMIQAFLKGVDIHTETAAEIFGVSLDKVNSDQRRIAKTVNFGILYGMSPYGLSQSLEISQEEAASYIKKYFEVHTGIKDYCNNAAAFAHEHGYIETLFGYRRNLSNINAPIYNIRDAEERMAINTPVQGTAAEILKLAMIELDKKLEAEGSKAKMLLTVHDELIIEAPKEKVKEIAKIITDAMENVIDLGLPIVAEVKAGKNWGEMVRL